MFGHNENLRCHLYCSNAVRTPRLKARGKLSVISFTVRAEARTNAQVLASFDIIGREFSVGTPRTIRGTTVAPFTVRAGARTPAQKDGASPLPENRARQATALNEAPLLRTLSLLLCFVFLLYKLLYLVRQ